MPSVSIIIPAYNAAPFLARAVRSAVLQTYTDIEIIIVDDGSTDATAAVMALLAAADPRIITIALPRNRGVSAARNAALARAGGEWIALLDADDEVEPSRIEYLLRKAAELGADMVADNLLMQNFESGSSLGLAFPDDWMTQHGVTPRYILERDIPGIFRREIAYIKPLIRHSLLTQNAISYNEDVRAAEDLLFIITCLRAGARLCLLPSSFYLYKLRENSISARGDANESSLRVNEILTSMLGTDPALRDLLFLRQDAVNFERFIWWVRQRDWRRALAAAWSIRKPFFLAKIFAAICRRLGLRVANPAAARLAKIREVSGYFFEKK